MKKLAFLNSSIKLTSAMLISMWLSFTALAASSDTQVDQKSEEKLYPLMDEVLVTPSKDETPVPLKKDNSLLSEMEGFDLLKGTLNFLNLSNIDLKPNAAEESEEVEKDTEQSDS